MPIFNIEGIDQDGNFIELPNLPTYIQDFYETVPGGGNWTYSKINTMILGFKSKE
jgi:hypothetical protein